MLNRYVLNCFHQKLGLIQPTNNPAPYESFIHDINSFKNPDKKIIFGLEDTQGLGHSLSQWLLDQGYTVKEINLALTKRERKDTIVQTLINLMKFMLKPLPMYY